MFNVSVLADASSSAGPELWVTATVAAGSAVIGSLAGAYGTYRASIGLERRRRKALAEIRRKAKVYTPIREELVALQKAIGEGRHLGIYAIHRERPQHQTMGRPPVLTIWREFVGDGRANTTASAKIRVALNRVEEATDTFNETLVTTRGTFKERGEAFSQESQFSLPVMNWYESEFATLLRDGIRGSGLFSDPFTDGPSAPASATLTVEQQGFATLWENDEVVREATEKLVSVERSLREAVQAAINELDAAMKRIADKYEHEPD